MAAAAPDEPLEAEWIEAAPDEAQVAPWHDLARRDPEASVFQTPAWTLPWWRHLGAGRPRLLVVRRGARWLALAALARIDERRAGIPVRLLAIMGERPRGAPQGEPAADHLGILADPEEPGALALAVEALLAARAGVDCLRLHEIREGTRTEAALRAGLRSARAEGRGGAVLVRTCARTPLLALDRPWEEIEAAYPRSLRTRLRRARARLRRLGRARIRRWLPAPDEVPALLERLAAVEARSWKGERGIGVFSQPRGRAFWADAGARLAADGALDVATLEVEGELAAYRLGLRAHDAYLDYNFAHDEHFARTSPGRLLLDEVIRDSHRQGLAWIDASGGSPDDAPLLADWTDHAVVHRAWMLFGRSARARALAAAARRLSPAWQEAPA